MRSNGIVLAFVAVVQLTQIIIKHLKLKYMNEISKKKTQCNEVNTLLCGVVYTLLNPSKPRVEWCTIEYMHNAWLMNWKGRDVCNIEHGESGFFLTLRAAKMYASKERLCVGNKSKRDVSHNAT